MMWWPFSKKRTIGETGIMSGLTDWHSHLLPGVDDGVRLPDETRQILTRYVGLGVRRVWLTPHVMDDVPNSPEALRARFSEIFQLTEPAASASRKVSLRAKWSPDGDGTTSGDRSIEIMLAAENMLDNLFDIRLESGDVLPIGSDCDHLLVETSYFNPPSDFIEKLRRTFAAGYYPILAHPERYVYMDGKYYHRLLDMGVKFQLNLYSLTGMYGSAAAQKARKLLSDGCYTLMGSDTHRSTQLDKALNAPVLTASLISALEKLKDCNYV